jgi:flavodoxin I
MARALIVYGSTSGNTAYASQFVQAGLESAGHEVVRKDVRTASIDELKDYDLVVLGSSTWDKDHLKLQGQLQVDMQPFADQLASYDFNQKPVAVFGLGHYSYTFTANAANILSDIVQKNNGRLVGDVFKVDDVVDLFTERLEEWAKTLPV